MITVNAAELRDLLARHRGMALLNVRPAPMTTEGFLPGSWHVPLAGLKARAPELLPDKGAPIALYGTDLTCETSTHAADTLEKLGYTQVYNFTAGLKGWRDGGFLVVADADL